MAQTYDVSTSNVTLALRNQFPAKTFAGKTVYVPFAELPAEVIVTLLEQGALRILNDGNGAKDLTDDERFAKMQKRVDAWKQGSFRVVDRADSLQSLMKECYVAEQVAKHAGTSAKQVETAIRATVKAELGDVNATFDNFLKAVAKQLAKRPGEKRSGETITDLLGGVWEGKAQALAAERAKANAKVTIDLGDFDI